MTSETTSPDPAEWRRVLPSIVAVFVATRLIVVLVAAVVQFTLVTDPAGVSGDVPDHRPILSSLVTSDAVYYLGIAAEGYHAGPVSTVYHDWAFFPLYPLAVRIASYATLGDFTVAGLLVANGAFLSAMAALYLLSRRHQDEQRALRSVVYLAIAPGAVAFSMVYSDSLFLLLLVAAFLAAEHRRWAVMGIMCALATLTRLPGLLLVIPLLVLQWQTLGMMRPAMAWLGLAPLALVGFSAYQGAVLGDPLAFLHAQGAWDIPPLISSSVPFPSSFSPLPFLLIGTLLFYTFLFVYMRADRIPLPYVAYAVVSVLTVLASGRLQSVGRYLAVVFPFDWVLANRRAAWFQASWPAISVGLFTIYALLHFTVLAP